MEPETLTTARLLLRTVGPSDAPAVLAAAQDPLIQRWTTVPSPYLPEHAVGFLTRQVPDGWRNDTMFTFGAFLRGTGVSDGAGRRPGAPSAVAGGDGGAFHGSPASSGSPGFSGFSGSPGDPAGSAAPEAAGPRETGAGAAGPGRAGGGFGDAGPSAPGAQPLVAMVGITGRGTGTGEIGFWATREHRGRGYVTEAVLAVTRWAFTRCGMDRVEWRAEVGNAGSRAVAERAGFTMEGVLRSAVANKGVRRDCWVGSLLPSDLDFGSTQVYLPAPQRQA